MALEHDSDSPLALAVRQAGSQTAFGELIGKRQSVIHDWLREQEYVPAEFVLLVEEKLGIPCWELNPEIYPPEKFAQSPGERPDGASAAEEEAAVDASDPSTKSHSPAPTAGEAPAAQGPLTSAAAGASDSSSSGTRPVGAPAPDRLTAAGAEDSAKGSRA